ncbi:MAG: dihydroneopterin aldolase [Cyclobacteriaceae bacterium]
MGKILLEGLRFHAHHGLHEVERKNGNSFLIDLELVTDFSAAAKTDNIDHTIDYEEVYSVVADAMSGSHYLLEHLGHKIIKALKLHFKGLNQIKVTVSKLNPSIGGECVKASIILEG